MSGSGKKGLCPILINRYESVTPDFFSHIFPSYLHAFDVLLGAMLLKNGLEQGKMLQAVWWITTI
jgi:hypothetical protein